MKCCRVTPGHVSFSAGARASSTIRSSQGLLHSLLSSACSFTHSYWFFIDLRCPPVPPLLILPPIHHRRLSLPPPSPSARWNGRPSLTLISSPTFLSLSLYFCSGSDPASPSRAANLSERAAARWTPRCGEERCWGSVWITAPTYEKRSNSTSDPQLEDIMVQVQKYKKRLECQREKNTFVDWKEAFRKSKCLPVRSYAIQSKITQEEKEKCVLMHVM